MKRLIFGILAVIIAVSCTSCNKNNLIESKKEIDLTAQIENNIELQKNTFVGKVKSVTQKNALITKYNFDITTYTVYTVEVTESIDGYTPLGEITVYCAGTSDEFLTRSGLKKNETYILDSEPWVYGDRIVYLLSVYTVAFPRIDIAGQVTLEQEDGTFVTLGDKDGFIKQYYDAKTDYAQSHSGFYDSDRVRERFCDIFTVICEKNSDTDIYNNEMYKWRPDDEFIQLTKTTSETVLKQIGDGRDITEILNTNK